jgi:two-component system nitrogen regulation sensor histidine kinase NtrY
MVLNKFYVNVLFRIIFIVLSGIALGIALQHLDRGYYYTLTGIIFLIMLQTWLLVNLVNKTNLDLEKFFSSVHDHDTSIRFSENARDHSYRKLYDSMNHLNTIIQDVKIKNERSGQFLQNLVDHVDIGLLSFDMNGRIEIFNRAAKRYLNVREPRQLSSLGVLNEEIVEILSSIVPGQEILHKMKIGNHVQRILVKATELKFEDNIIKLVSLQDITNELDKKELESWQKLIRVLTHEIMNSISPITSLTLVIAGYFRNKTGENPVSPGDIDQQTILKTLSGLNTIEETGKGLLDFVEKYRSFTSLPMPEKCTFNLDKLFLKCKILMEPTIPKNIKMITQVTPVDLKITADFTQIEHILINLIRNAIDAIYERNKGVIRLNALRDNEGILILVEDNGTGITEELAEEIFVPFFTTKKNGSGIGLSLSKQIMKNHNGTISVHSRPDERTTFTLKFPG